MPLPEKSDSALHVQPGVAPTPSVNPQLRPRLRKLRPVAEYVAGIQAGDRGLLSQAITLVESTHPAHQALAQEVLAALTASQDSLRVGVTGVPGVGKSTFLDALGTFLTQQGHRIAVLAIDPSSTRTKGSILGDKTRMDRLAADPHAFIRPSPTAGSLGGVARRTRETIRLCEAAGFDVVFIETVGVGQSETTVHSMVDFFLLLALAGAGDELQGIKRGIMEMADALVINKADGENRPAARQAKAQYRSALRLFPPTASGWTPEVATCSALTGEGIEAVWTIIERYRRQTQASGYFAAHRREQARYWLRQAIEHHLHTRFFADPAVQERLSALEQAVVEGRLSPFVAAQQLVDRDGPESERHDG